MVGKIKIASAKAAIWTDEGDELPFSSPLSHLGRVKFHTDLDYIKVVSTLSATINLPLVTNVAQRVASYLVGAHGQAGQPFVLGQVTVQGQPTAFTGSVCVQQGDNNGITILSPSYGRFLALGADSTNVYVHEYLVAYGDASASNFETYAALSLGITCYVTNRILS